MFFRLIYTMSKNYDAKDLENEIQRAFEFLSNRYKSRQAFSKEEFQKYIGWSDLSFEDFFKYLFSPLLLERNVDQFQVS